MSNLSLLTPQGVFFGATPSWHRATATKQQAGGEGVCHGSTSSLTKKKKKRNSRLLWLFFLLITLSVPTFSARVGSMQNGPWIKSSRYVFFGNTSKNVLLNIFDACIKQLVLEGGLYACSRWLKLELSCVFRFHVLSCRIDTAALRLFQAKGGSLIFNLIANTIRVGGA